MEQVAAIIGAGLIGRAWATVFARAGWQVRLYDCVPAQLDTARGHIATSLAEQQAGLVADAQVARAVMAEVGQEPILVRRELDQSEH